MELHRRAWYMRTDEVIATCDLQKSQYGPSYYLNVGYYLRSSGDMTHPKSYECDISLRGEVFLGDASGLAVGPNKVVPERVESLERGLAAEAAVGSAVIVEVEPGGEGALSLPRFA